MNAGKLFEKNPGKAALSFACLRAQASPKSGKLLFRKFVSKVILIPKRKKKKTEILEINSQAP
jgi:hypothetical protein